MKKTIFLALLLLCTTIHGYVHGQTKKIHKKASSGIRKADSEAKGLHFGKRNLVNYLTGVPDEFTQYFNWTPEDYFVLYINEIFPYYTEMATGKKIYVSHQDVIRIISNSKLISPSEFTETIKDPKSTIPTDSITKRCWETCGKEKSTGKAIFSWFGRTERSVANGDALWDEMFMSSDDEIFGGATVPHTSDNCGNGVRLKQSCIQKIVYNEPQPLPQALPEQLPEEEEDEYVQKEVVEYEYVWVDVTPPEIHSTVLRMQPDVIQQQIVCNNEPQQPVYQNPPQNRLVYNYYGGGNNAGWGGGFQQPSNYSNQQSWANNQSANSSNVNDNSNVFNNNTNVSYTSQPRPNTSNPNNYTSGSPAGVPGSNGLGWNGPGGVPSSGNNGGPVGVPGNGGPAGVPGSGNYGPGFSSGGGPSGAGGSGGRMSWH